MHGVQGLDENHRCGSKAASAAQTAELRPQGPNGPKPVWIIPPRFANSSHEQCNQFLGAIMHGVQGLDENHRCGSNPNTH